MTLILSSRTRPTRGSFRRSPSSFAFPRKNFSSTSSPTATPPPPPSRSPTARPRKPAGSGPGPMCSSSRSAAGSRGARRCSRSDPAMKIGFLFSGQGSQAVGMGKAFYDAMPAVRELFDAAETALSMPIKKFLFEGPEETLTRTDITQPAIALVSLAALRVARDRGIEAHAACGHSLGEYAALVSAGVMEELDALRVVARRGQAMQAAADAAPGIMAAVVGLSLDQVQAALGGIAGLQVAGPNPPDQIVPSGETAAV